MLSLSVPVHVKSLPKLKLIQILLKITSIVPNLTFKGHPRSKVIQFKDHEVYGLSVEVIYMYMAYTCTCIGLPLCASCKIWS